MQTLNFQTKARNLKNLQNRLKSAKILPLIITSLNEFQKNEKQILSQIKCLNADKIIIRSSSSSEDKEGFSNAGAFLSLANIDAKDENAVCEALLRVAQSMPSKDDEILIQPCLEQIKLCGVAFSADKDTLAPYFCIQYDESGSNDSITSGAKASLKSYFEYKFITPKRALNLENKRLEAIIKLIKELEKIYQSPFLDIEFAFASDEFAINSKLNSNANLSANLNSKDPVKNSSKASKSPAKSAKESLYCLQVRPISTQNKLNLYHALPKEALNRLYKRLKSLETPKPRVLGQKAVFGVMPDWNPAEIIGLRPKRLAFSLYKEIITDNIWAYQRDNYGYKDLRSHPLMHSFLGMPFIDVRASFNSFVPKNLDKNISKKLVNFYLKSLIKAPNLHDKVEFEILFSCYDLNTASRLKKLLDFSFNENELKRLEFALLELTNKILDKEKGLYLKDIAKTKKLISSYKELKNSKLPLFDKIYWLLEECKRYGTLPFAGVARAAFVAMQLLNSLVEIKFLSQGEKESFLNSLQTVSKKLAFKSATLSPKNKASFLKEFGHLRAGTYNILSNRYDKAFESYFDYAKNANLSKAKDFKLEPKRLKELDRLLRENGLKLSAKELFSFFKAAIEGREFVKFEFSKLLSHAIELIKELGENYGIAKEDMAYLDIKNILDLYSSLYSKSPKERFLDEIKRAKKEYELSLALKLPPLISEPGQIFSFFAPVLNANFITQKSITAKTARENESDLRGKIVLIFAADPGYDYLFSKDIAGFITCYGGANSHMAIRASELNLPAVIGVGEEAFGRYLGAEKIVLDCASEQVICL